MVSTMVCPTVFIIKNKKEIIIHIAQSILRVYTNISVITIRTFINLIYTIYLNFHNIIMIYFTTKVNLI